MADSSPVATKGNLIQIRKSLALARLGFELIDRKRNILVREMMSQISAANALRESIDPIYKKAYKALQRANVTLGVCTDVANSLPVEGGLSLTERSVMGVILTRVNLDSTICPEVPYSLSKTNSQLDIAYICFSKVKEQTVRLAEIENSVYRLALEIKKTQKRANALQNIVIPRYTVQERQIADALEEKEREEFSRLKVIKRLKPKK